MALERAISVEVTRSFGAKVSLGAQSYESRDFFCSAKALCDPKDRSAIAKELYQFCKAEVYDSIRQYKAKERARFKKAMGS